MLWPLVPVFLIADCAAIDELNHLIPLKIQIVVSAELDELLELTVLDHFQKVKPLQMIFLLLLLFFQD